MSIPIIWLLVAAALAFAEILTESLFLTPLVAAAVVIALGNLIGLDVALIAGLGFSAAVMTLLLLRPLLRRARTDFEVGGAEHDFVVGQFGVVEERVVNQESTGVIEIEGEIWTARAQDDSQTFAPGTEVEVVAVRGAVALVEERENRSRHSLRA